VLLGLVFENLNIDSVRSPDERSITASDITHFEAKRTERGAEFRLSVPQCRVIASSRLDLERLEPLTVVYREFVGKRGKS
jgi:hypothetical protein